MKYHVLRKSSVQIIGMEFRANSAQSVPNIASCWAAFWKSEAVDQLLHQSSQEKVGFYVDYEKGEKAPCSIFIGCEVGVLANVPTGMISKTLPATAYAVYQPEQSKMTKQNLRRKRVSVTQPVSGAYSFQLEQKTNQKKPGKLSIYIAIK